MVIAERPARLEATTPQTLSARYAAVRARSQALAAPLSAEDQQVQSMPDVSPTKWHLAHVTWFFETFLLKPCLDGYAPLDEAFHYLFNSYYEAEGPRQPRPERGLITRPGAAEVAAYRAHVDRAMGRLLESPVSPRVAELVELGLNHEQQHQELILMDIKHVLSRNPLMPAYAPSRDVEASEAAPLAWREFPAGLRQIGHGGEGFAFDNEAPRHRVYLEAFAVADRLTTCGEYLAFIDAGGYREPSHRL
jgi:ergothioneine biosynthesis protein EgtB